MACGKGTGNFVWVRGPSPGSEHDLVMFRLFGLSDRLESGELVLGDKGYQGHGKCIVPYKNHGYRHYHDTCVRCKFNFKLCGVRIVIERAFSRIKNFRCLSTRWRHDLKLHPVAFYFIAEICNILNKLHPCIYFVVVLYSWGGVL